MMLIETSRIGAPIWDHRCAGCGEPLMLSDAVQIHRRLFDDEPFVSRVPGIFHPECGKRALE